jgi:hypothetical protein
MFLAIAAESLRAQEKPEDYKVWFLELDSRGKVINIGVKNRKELVANLFDSYRKTGKSNWRAFRKNSERSTPIELYDFISKNMFENTHFGSLPTLGEFQETLNALRMNLELKAIA